MKASFVSVLVVIVCCLAAGTVLAEKPDVQKVSSDEAKAAALQLVAVRAMAKPGPFIQWKGAEIGEPTKYVGLDGQHAAYCFPVEKEKTAVGYVMVSTLRTEMPIQEFACSAPPHTGTNIQACRDAAKEAAGAGKELGPLKYTYLAPGLHAVEFPLSENGMTAGSVLVDMLTSQVITISDLASKQTPAVSRGAKATQAWSAVANPEATPKSPAARLSPEFGYVINVPLVISCTGQDAMAWASMLAYWGVRKPRETPELIAQQLGKSGIGRDSLQSFAKERGFRLALSNRRRDASAPESAASFTDVRIEADSGRPFILSASVVPAEGKAVTSTLAGAGYAVDEIGQWLIVHTSISPTESVAQSEQSAPWCRPGVLFINWDCSASPVVQVAQISRPADPSRQ